MAFFTALALGSLAVSAVSQIKAGKAQKAAGKAARSASESEAQLDEFNASVADVQAQDAITRGQEDENRFRMGVRGMVGSQRSAIAASNVDVGFGSAVDVQSDATYLGELDALTIRTNAAREAWGYNVQGSDLRKRADIARKEGVNLEKAGSAAGNASYIAAGGTLLAGTANLMADKYGMRKKVA